MKMKDCKKYSQPVLPWKDPINLNYVKQKLVNLNLNLKDDEIEIYIKQNTPSLDKIAFYKALNDYYRNVRRCSVTCQLCKSL